MKKMSFGLATIILISIIAILTFLYFWGPGYYSGNLENQARDVLNLGSTWTHDELFHLPEQYPERLLDRDQLSVIQESIVWVENTLHIDIVEEKNLQAPFTILDARTVYVEMIFECRSYLTKVQDWLSFIPIFNAVIIIGIIILFRIYSQARGSEKEKS